MRLRAEDIDEEVTISLTPLIDVVFILLIFFMLASSFLDWQQVEIQALRPGSQPATPNERQIVMIEKTGDGGLRLDGKILSAGELAIALQALADHPEMPRIFVRVADGTPMQETVDLLMRVREAGLSDFALLEGP